MTKITITLNDDNMTGELLKLLTALPYVESAYFDDAEEATNGHDRQTKEDTGFDADDEDSPFYHDPQTHLMDQEITAFEAMKAELAANYLGQYVAIFHRQLVDHDKDKARLLGRITQTYPHDVVLIRQVRSKPRPPFRLWSPQLHRN